MLGLYIHIPFCNNICPYCDFTKTVSTSERKNSYIEALCREMKLKKLDNYSFKSVYIGGGTPSSLDLNKLDYLLTSLNNYINLSDLEEFTIECNPKDITLDFIKLIKKHHITRVSIGVQTLNPKLQKTINRFVTINELDEIVNKLRLNGIENINIDLMYAIPGETLDDLNNDLSEIIKLNVPHLSVYSLILEEKTIFYHLYKKGTLDLISEDLESTMYKTVVSRLKSNGYNHYETSNFSKIGYESRHNLIYWNCDEYIAIGAAGSSYFENRRTTNTKNITKYINKINNFIIELDEDEFISKEEAMNEMIILGLRKCSGINTSEFLKKFGTEITEQFPKIHDLIKEGLLAFSNNHLFIPEEHIYISNHIIVKILN